MTPIRTLELFAGTQSFSKGILRHSSSNTAITLDMLPLFKPTICCDILTWDYKSYPVGFFDIIWASPPCTEYSKAKTHGQRNLALADRLVERAFEIIEYLQPKVWIVENVGTGLLVNRMNTIRVGLSSTFVDYCAYGKPYRKRTIFWSNKPLTLKLCSGVGKCPSMEGRKHIGSCGNGTKTYNSVGIRSVWEKDSIPESLIDQIILQLLL